MNKITKKEYPSLFQEIGEFVIDDSRRDHRRGSNFFVDSIVEFTADYAKFFPEITDFTPFIGTWETNTYIWDDNHGAEWNEIDTLTRVEKKEVVTTKTVWEPVS